MCIYFEEDSVWLICCGDMDASGLKFKDKVEKLVDDLEAVKSEPDEVEQCKKLQKIFGTDFHIPEVKTVSKKQKNCIPSSSASGVR